MHSENNEETYCFCIFKSIKRTYCLFYKCFIIILVHIPMEFFAIDSLFPRFY